MWQLLREGCAADFAGLVTDPDSTSEKANGGVEERDVRVVEIPEGSPHRQKWRDLRTLAVVTRRTEREGLETLESRLYVSSLPPDAKTLSHTIRSRWAIENSLHWSMDVTFGEDRHRQLDRNGVQDLSAVRRLAVSILRQDKTVRLGAKNKRLKAALDPDYALHVLENARI
jgi:predicted transposase YbfD/YdcC